MDDRIKVVLLRGQDGVFRHAPHLSTTPNDLLSLRRAGVTYWGGSGSARGGRELAMTSHIQYREERFRGLIH